MHGDQQPPSPEQQLARQLLRSAVALVAGGILLVLSGTFVGPNAPSLGLMSLMGLAMLVLGAALWVYSRRLAGPRG